MRCNICVLMFMFMYLGLVVLPQDLEVELVQRQRLSLLDQSTLHLALLLLLLSLLIHDRRCSNRRVREGHKALRTRSDTTTPTGRVPSQRTVVRALQSSRTLA